MKRLVVYSLAIFPATLIASTIALAQSGWMESWSHHDGYEPQYEYHVHAYVGAEYYVGGDELCHWREWVHGKNDTEIVRDDTGTLWVYYTTGSDPEAPWTHTSIRQGSSEIDYESVSLPNFQYCPF